MNILRIRTVMMLAVMTGMSMPAWAANEAVAGEAAAAEASAPEAAGDAEHGREIFNAICSHCHNLTHETSSVGAPGLKGVLDRRSEEWVNHWITSPEEFAKKDPTAKKLVQSNPYGLTMPTLPETQSPQNRRDIIEFLKTLSEGKGKGTK